MMQRHPFYWWSIKVNGTVTTITTIAITTITTIAITTINATIAITIERVIVIIIVVVMVAVYAATVIDFAVNATAVELVVTWTVGGEVVRDWVDGISAVDGDEGVSTTIIAIIIVIFSIVGVNKSFKSSIPPAPSLLKCLFKL